MIPEERDQLIENLRLNNEVLQQKNQDLTTAISSTNFSPNKDNNLIQMQLDASLLLSNIEHFLKGDKVIVDEKGNEFYSSPEDPNQILLNDYGVNLIMSTIGQYIDKNTFLSFYTVERINEILADLGEELSDVIFCNYEKMGMTTEFKKSRYKLIVITILHCIENAYRRAIAGKAMEELNTSRLYTPNLGMNNNQMLNQALKPKQGFFNKFNW